jgi:hypothetical protein
MKPIHLTVFLLFFSGAGALADDQNDRQALVGSWVLQSAAENNQAIIWTFSAARNALQVTQLEGSSKVVDFRCGTDGVSCETNVGGKKAQVSMWFNGPRLVEMETVGSDIIKRRFRILSEGELMEMEVIPIVPRGNTQTFEFKRAAQHR